MFKISKNLLIGIICFISSETTALNSSSYLISNTAIKLLDFEEAYLHYKKYETPLVEYDLHNKLLTFIHLNMLTEAVNIASDILQINNLNQEAWIVYLTDAKLRNKIDRFEIFNDKTSNYEMGLLRYIFFTNKNEIKNNKKIAKSIFEVVQATIAENQNKDNYSFLLFYLSIANLFDPYFDEAFYFIAQIYQQLEYYEKAEIFYNKVSNTHEFYVDSQKNIAINKSKLGLFNKGEEKLLNLINIYPSKIELVMALADLYRDQKKYEKAINYYTASINKQNDTFFNYWRLYYLRGICFERLNKWELAEKDFLYSLNIQSDNPQVLNYLAYGWLERDYNLINAMRMLKKAYGADPESYYILDSLGWAYYKMGQFHKAAEIMEEVILMAPGEAISLDHLGDIYFAMNRKREAKYFWKQALDLSIPEDMITDILKEKLKFYNAG